MDFLATNLVCENMSLFCIGSQHCPPGHSYAVSYDDRYLIHYVVSGKGKAVYNGKTYHLSKGNAFLIYGKNEVYYEADMVNPWYYIWINISGSMASNFIKSVGLSEENPIYKTKRPDIIEKHFEALVNTKDENNDFLVSGAMLTLLGDMIKYNHKESQMVRKTGEEYITMCKNYVQVNYYRRLTVDELCRYVGLEHSYLYRLFKNKEGISPYDYIIQYKLEKAKKLLLSKEYSIGEIASFVGYEDKLAFSKLFSRKYGISPSQYRKNAVSSKILYDIH